MLGRRGFVYAERSVTSVVPHEEDMPWVGIVNLVL